MLNTQEKDPNSYFQSLVGTQITTTTDINEQARRMQLKNNNKKKKTKHNMKKYILDI